MTERLLAPKWANLLLVGTGCVVALTFVLAAVGGPKLLSSSTQVADGFDANTCRSQYSGRITDARTHLDDARADVQKATYIGLKAATVAPDPATLVEATRQGDEATLRAQHWQTETLRANSAYQRLLDAEVHHHDRFLSLCRKVGS